MTDFSLYIHVPFCKAKCRYCDFYSLAPDGNDTDLYTVRVVEEMQKWGARIVRPISTLYLGGGTPTLLGGEGIGRIITAAQRIFTIRDNAEITLECNPADDLRDTLSAAKKAGVNRLSIGVQSGDNRVLSLLGRRHTASDAAKTVALARELGFLNISLDLMIGLPESSPASVAQSIDFVSSLSPEHISVYMLKIEPGTPFGLNPPVLPDEDETADQYLFTVDRLESLGYKQYEISNFCKEGFESRHNTNYWLGGEYLGVGPAAHSYVDGRRFYYPRDLEAFMRACSIVPDGNGGGRDEYIMLRLRLCRGIDLNEYNSRFGPDEKLIKTAAKLQKAGLVQLGDNTIRLTKQGFLVSNAVIGEFI